MGALSTIAEAVHDELDDGTIVHKVGAEHLDTNDAPPLVVWVHRRVKHEPQGSQIGPRETGATDELGEANELGNQFLTRWLGVSLHVWAASSDDADVLVVDLLRAVYNRLSMDSARFLGEVWPKQETHEHLKHGENVIVALEVASPVLTNKLPTFEVKSVTGPTLDLVEEL